MSEDLLASAITVAVIIVMFAWVPLLKLVCPPCITYLQNRRRRLPVARETMPVTRRAA